MNSFDHGRGQVETRNSSTQAYWVRITGDCTSTDSETALVSVKPVITQAPASATICTLGGYPR